MIEEPAGRVPRTSASVMQKADCIEGEVLFSSIIALGLRQYTARFAVTMSYQRHADTAGTDDVMLTGKDAAAIGANDSGGEGSGAGDGRNDSNASSFVADTPIASRHAVSTNPGGTCGKCSYVSAFGKSACCAADIHSAHMSVVLATVAVGIVIVALIAAVVIAGGPSTSKNSSVDVQACVRQHQPDTLMQEGRGNQQLGLPNGGSAPEYILLKVRMLAAVCPNHRHPRCCLPYCLSTAPCGRDRWWQASKSCRTRTSCCTAPRSSKSAPASLLLLGPKSLMHSTVYAHPASSICTWAACWLNQTSNVRVTSCVAPLERAGIATPACTAGQRCGHARTEMR